MSDEAKQVMAVDVEFTDDPLPFTEIDGLQQAVHDVNQGVQETVFVECDDKVTDYKVYWNDKTETVRIGAVVPGAVYEVSQDYYWSDTDD